MLRRLPGGDQGGPQALFRRCPVFYGVAVAKMRCFFLFVAVFFFWGGGRDGRLFFLREM